ncbi:MAG: hypothetical protein K2X81_14555 [Candidatus Obscuribacterales bacterium]|nr:hypothetical protein [Candidatus Obscuribacterales bacterium]
MIAILLATTLTLHLPCIDIDRTTNATLAQAIDIPIDPRYGSGKIDPYPAFDIAEYRNNVAKLISKDWSCPEAVPGEFMLLVTISQSGIVRRVAIVSAQKSAKISKELRELVGCVKAQQFPAIPKFCSRNDDLMFKFEINDFRSLGSKQDSSVATEPRPIDSKRKNGQVKGVSSKK